jgi:hypothetical protein
VCGGASAEPDPTSPRLAIPTGRTDHPCPATVNPPPPQQPRCIEARTYGKNFDQRKSLAAGNNAGVVHPPPTIAVSESNVYVIWLAEPFLAPFKDVFVAHSEDSGKTFGKGLMSAR